MKTPKKSKTSIRLPSHITPIRYNLTLKPDLENFTFWGKEVIDLVIDKEVKEITLHSKDIDIETAQAGVQFATKISYDIKAETATFTFKNKIPKGKIKLTLVFNGIINETLRGFYKSKYEIDGVTKHLATTQFEATDARRAFPCFDEPAQKAVFDVSLIIPGTHTAISNTLPTSIKEHEAGYKIISFAPTPKMSTYLLAFIIGDFEYVEKNAGQTLVRVYTTSGKKHQAKFALDTAIRCLEFYNKYFDIPYPLPTLDLIAIPDFESAAMENWGAITFRETALLVDAENTSLVTKQWVAIVIAHEIAHQWFGNLVTMKWWTDLWLNEGFASYMENLCTDHLFPEWHVWDLYLADRYAVALKLDALQNSHPVEVTVHHPDEISEIFDMVSYAKGSAVIRMLAEYLGADVFRDGLRHYLKKHSYNNTETIQLWESFEKVSKKNVVKMMNTWTKQTGYPLITLSKKGNQYSAAQERFFSSRISREKYNKGKKQLWHTPFAYKTNNEILKTISTKNKVPLIGANIGKLNFEERSFVRTRYDKETILRLKEEILDGKLSVKDRLGLIRDMFALAEGGYIDTVTALDFSLAYKNETEYIVWAELASGIGKVYALFGDDTYKKYALSLFSPLAEKMTWNHIKGEPHSHTFLRSLAISGAGSYGDKNIIKHAEILFKDRIKNPIRADIRSTVYAIVAQNGGQKEWNLFKNLYLKEKMHEEQERYGRALAQFRDNKNLCATLHFAISSDVRTQDAPFMIGAVWGNTYGRDLAWKFVKSNYKIILKTWGEGGHFLSRLLSPLGTHSTKKDAEDIKKFFKRNPAPGSARTLEQAYEKIYSNVSWVQADKNNVKKWINNNYK
ncbi:MAG: puromycin-sensitive aminopeptidase [Patescibacteria group bacterium]|jgi:puromycin-sensitive aminopeptidase|nr:puromycin-sensitive aminopeptidase [Patescibacteria group bacterium]